MIEEFSSGFLVQRVEMRLMGRAEGTHQLLSANHLKAVNNQEKLRLSM